MKVAFVADGGPRVGLGHLGRCAAIAQAFKSTRRADPVFFVKDKASRQWLAKKGFSSRPVFSGSWDLVVADSYRLSKAQLKTIRLNSRQLLMVNDIGRVPSFCDWVLNSSPAANRAGYGKSRSQFLLGTRFHPLRAEIAALKPARIKKNVANVFVTLGGIVWGNLLERSIRSCSARMPKARFHVVIGPRGKTFKAERVTFHRSPKNIGAIMRNCDMAVSGGGQTLFELAHVGVPTVAIQLASNQSGIVRGFERSGFIVKARNLGQDVSRVADNFKKRQQMAKAGISLVDGKGGRRIVERLAGKNN